MLVCIQTHLRISFALMVIVLALVFRWTARVVPRKRIVCIVVLMHVRVHGRASCPRRVFQRRIYGAFRADAFSVLAFERAPAAVRVMQTLRTLLERVTRSRALVLIGLCQNQSANPARAVHGLIRGRYTRAEVTGPVALRETTLSAIRTQARLAVVVQVTPARALVFCDAEIRVAEFERQGTQICAAGLIRCSAGPVEKLCRVVGYSSNLC